MAAQPRNAIHNTNGACALQFRAEFRLLANTFNRRMCIHLKPAYHKTTFLKYSKSFLIWDNWGVIPISDPD
jgi:hypothetical protein